MLLLAFQPTRSGVSTVHRLLIAWNTAFRPGNEAARRTVRASLSCGIKEAKRKYTNRIAHHFSDSRETRCLWQGIQNITGHKLRPQTCDSNLTLINKQNNFFTCFEAHNRTSAQRSPPPPDDCVLSLSPASIKKSLSRISARKTGGPDNIPGRLLKECAEELTDVLTDSYNTSLSQAVVSPHASKPPPSSRFRRRPHQLASMTTAWLH